MPANQLLLSNLLGAVVGEVDRQILILATSERQGPLFALDLAVAGGFNHDLVVVPILTRGQLRGRKLADFAGLLRFDAGQRNRSIGRNVQCQAGFDSRRARSEVRRHWAADSGVAAVAVSV